MTIKLKIDFAQGQLDVEGSDDVVVKIYNDFMAKWEKITPEIVQLPAKSIPLLEVIDADKPAGEQGKKKATKKTAATQNYTMVDEIYKGEYAKAIKDFYGCFNAKGNLQKVTLFVYCLQKNLDIKGITVNHLYTCYKIVSEPLPKVLPQAVRDAKSQKTWLVHDDWSDLKITHMGENAVEHEFEKVQKAA